MENEDGRRNKLICFHIEKRQKLFLEKIAEERGISLSELLRDIIFNYITNDKKTTEKATEKFK